MKTLYQPKCRPLPSLTTTSVATESEWATSDANIGWDGVAPPQSNPPPLGESAKVFFKCHNFSHLIGFDCTTSTSVGPWGRLGGVWGVWGEVGRGG